MLSGIAFSHLACVALSTPCAVMVGSNKTDNARPDPKFGGGKSTLRGFSPAFSSSVPFFVPFVAIRWRGRGCFAKVQASEHHLITQKELIMNIAKNMEIIFVAALALAGATTLASAAAPKFHAHVAVSPVVGEMQTVVIVGKRLSAAEKAAL